MSLTKTIQSLLGEGVTLHGNVSGGDINVATRGETDSGRQIFVKTNAHSPRGMFTAEAAGLEALGAVANGCRIPQVMGVSDDPAILILEWIERGSPTAEYSAALGHGLAAQHRVTRPKCGFDAGDNYIGSTAQPNPDEDDWLTFFRDHRIGFQQNLLRQQGRCSAALDRMLDQFRDRIDTWLALDDEPHALLHGDLWSGNKMCDAASRPVLIDPATYFGCREADLAMTQLFGGFSSAFYGAYNEAYPLQPEYEKRRDLYNLYHVLNHANLFGGGYASQAERTLSRFL